MILPFELFILVRLEEQETDYSFVQFVVLVRLEEQKIDNFFFIPSSTT